MINKKITILRRPSFVVTFHYRIYRLNLSSDRAILKPIRSLSESLWGNW